MPKHVFISYARADAKEAAGHLRDYLEAAGFSAWFDSHDIAPGQHWDSEIEQSIRDCWALLFLMTPASLTSSNCHDEWSLAVNSHKPVLPLKLAKFPDANIPMRLARRQYIDFTGGFELGLARLREHLAHMRRTQTEIEDLERQQSDLRREQAHAPTDQVSRIQTKIKELQEQVDYKQRALAEPEVVRAENRRAIEVGLDSERERIAKAREMDRSLNRRRVVGSAPQGVSEAFRDRVRQAADITNTLLGDETARAVSIIGKGGVGKTALACRVMEELERDHEAVHGLVYLSTRSGLGISLEQIVLHTARMLGGEAEKSLNAAWTNTHLDTAGKIQILLEQVGDHRCILLLDNLEDLLDGDGHLKDAELRLFVDMFLRQKHKTRLLITTREPLNPANDVRKFDKPCPLDEGLPETDAIALLRGFDADGETGLRDASAALLREMVSRTHGFPRALEAAFGILKNDPLLTPEQLLENTALFAQEVTVALVREAQSRLDDDARRVMQALAVYGRPVTEAAVRFLLEQYEGSLDIGAVIRRLARARYITVKRNTGELVIHPLDRDYNYQQIPVGADEDYNREALERRAGNYYVQLRVPREQWKTIADLEPQLAEFDHRIRAGDYDTAARLVDEIDFDYLLVWGHVRRALAMREQLLGKIRDRWLASSNLLHLEIDCRALGQVKRGIAYAEQALAIKRELGDKNGEGALLGNLGLAHSDLGQLERALEYYQQALAIARQTGDRRSQGLWLGSVGLAYYELIRVPEAITNYQQALDIARQTGDRLSEGVWLGNLGSAYQSLGQLERAASQYQQALEVDRQTGFRRSEGWNLSSLADIYSAQGNYERAQEYYEQSLAIQREVGARSYEGFALLGLGHLCLDRDQLDEAQRHFSSALGIADEVQSPIFQQNCRLYLARTHLYRDCLDDALTAVQTALEYHTPNKSGVYVVCGVIQARRAEWAAARTTFEKAVAETDALLAKSPGLYDAHYTRGLALAGSALCQAQQNAPHQVNAAIQAAVAAYRDARQLCAAPGVLISERRLLNELAKTDTDALLAPVQAVLK